MNIDKWMGTSYGNFSPYSTEAGIVPSQRKQALVHDSQSLEPLFNLQHEGREGEFASSYAHMSDY